MAGAEDATKRRRLEQFSPDDYAPGSIHRVTVHNFMSYSDAELVHPGPRLNCIIGPNGTGKSSIVQALTVGLAGDMKITERGARFQDCIKRGCDEGWTEIELRDADGKGKNLVIRCTITKSNRTYHMNGARARRPLSGRACRPRSHPPPPSAVPGAKVGSKDVVKRVKDLNIQIDNMLQFLPQDRVAAFTNMSPPELLVNTMKATLPEQYAQHQALITDTKSVLKMEDDLKQQERALEELNAKKAKLAVEVSRFREFDVRACPWHSPRRRRTRRRRRRACRACGSRRPPPFPPSWASPAWWWPSCPCRPLSSVPRTSRAR